MNRRSTVMRTYPENSPQAAARIVALTLVADGDIADAEIEWLDQLAVHEQLGLTRHELHQVIDSFCEDLLSSHPPRWADACPVDERTLGDLLDEIQDPALRLKLLHICVELAEADAQVANAESVVLVAAVEHWGLHHAMFRPHRQAMHLGVV
jgi:uncharacterized tellurite resistance protein B-like protein